MIFQVKSRQEQQLKVRNFLPPQSDEPEIFILDQEGKYSGNYGAKNGKPRKQSLYFCQTFQYCHSNCYFDLIDIFGIVTATKTDMVDEIKKLKKENKEGMEKQEDLMNSAKVLQGRINEGQKVNH